MKANKRTILFTARGGMWSSNDEISYSWSREICYGCAFNCHYSALAWSFEIGMNDRESSFKTNSNILLEKNTERQT